MKPVITIEELQSELLDLLERVTKLIEKAEVIQVGRPARSEKPSSPPTPSPQKPSDKHPWRTPKVAAIPLGVKPKIPAVLPECPCVNPTKDDCAKLVPPGIHTRGTGAAAQYSRCRLNDEPAPPSQRKGQLFGHLCDANCGRRTSNRYRVCASCRASGQGGAVASSAAS